MISCALTFLHGSLAIEGTELACARFFRVRQTADAQPKALPSFSVLLLLEPRKPSPGRRLQFRCEQRHDVLYAETLQSAGIAVRRVRRESRPQRTMEHKMRMMMKVSIPVEAGNKAIADGTLPKTMMGFMETFKPEAAYFLPEAGRRTGIFFFDLADPTDIPAAAEEFFLNLNAAIELTPAMNAADMKAGVEKAMKNR